MYSPKNIDILFFERPLVDLRKFAFKIAKELKLLNKDLKLGAIALELPGPEEQTDVDYFYHRKEIKDIDSFLVSSGVNVIVFTQSRIPDLEFILHAKKLNIKTIMIQEGVMFDGMNINDVSASNMIAILGYIPKVISYLNILRRICVYDHRSFVKVIFHILKIKKNITIIIANSFSTFLIGDYVLTMGDYWDDYYTNKLGYASEQIRLIGDHDLDNFQSSNENEAAICYIANVLVEDGTVRKKDFDEFLKAFAEAVDKNTKLYIKLHPRSDQSLYDVFKDHKVEFIRIGKLPSVNLYVGHRSALLGRALYESDNLIIWRFVNEEFCFYERFATATCTNKEELIRSIKNVDITKRTNQKLEEIKKVYWNNPEGSIHSAARLIYDYSQGIKI